MSMDELADFYRRIGAALWHFQCLEDVLVNFLTVKVIYERRRAGHSISDGDAQSLLAEKRKMTLGPLIDSCVSKKIISPQSQPRFETFKHERHWLVHRSMVDNADDLYLTDTRNAVFGRIIATQEEAISLKKLVFQDLESWMAAHGVDVTTAQNDADAAIRKLKGD